MVLRDAIVLGVEAQFPHAQQSKVDKAQTG